MMESKKAKPKMVSDVTPVETIDTSTKKRALLEFKVLRENPNDPFKPTSESAIRRLARNPPKRILKPEDEQLLQSVAADLDRSLSIEEIVTSPYPEPKIPFDCIVELDKLPSWLRSMIKARFSLIHDHFKEETSKFIKNLATRVEQRILLGEQDYGGYEFRHDAPLPQPTASKTSHFRLDETDLEEKEPTFFEKAGGRTIFRVAQAVGKWKKRKETTSSWDQSHLLYATEKLRQGLSMRAGAHDLLLVEEDAHIHQHGESSDEEGDDRLEKQKPKWEDMFRQGELELEAEREVDKKLHIREGEGDGAGMQVQVADPPAEEGKQQPAGGQGKKGKKPKLPLPKIAWMKRRKKRETELMRRGHFRRYSKLFYTGCGDAVAAPERLEHHHRVDESFHSFTMTLVGWVYFQQFVMAMIFINALILAIETFDIGEEDFVVFDVFDELFLAFYLTEAMIKIYAHPFRYWTSGFNLFDFAIIVVSIVKSVFDWLDLSDIGFLRVLLIVRALRVLRSISLSLQLQVLVTALVETVRKHVLSVVILLTLLIYIAAIVAYYLFQEKLDEVWGFVPQGMLRMIAYVTLDGWTDLQREFEEVHLQMEGRVFNLVCIVLGNFMFSNIFIAIIIFNISEATDLFRERIRTEREMVLKRKKETVFRRQKLDMRQLLARQKKSFAADFFFMATQFQKLLRHDDLVAMRETCTSPLWIDSIYQTLVRTAHTSNVLLNLHREMADNMLALHRLHGEGKMDEKTISRGRYNRYMRIKAKLGLIKNEILRFRGPPSSNLRIRFEKKK